MIRYLLTLPVRMAYAAAEVVVDDVDRALCLRAAAHYMDAFAASAYLLTEEV